MKKEYIYLILIALGVTIIYFVIKNISKKPLTLGTTGGAPSPSKVVTESTIDKGVIKKYWVKAGGKVYPPDKGDDFYPPTLGYTWSANPVDDFRNINATPIFTASVDASLGDCKIIATESYTTPEGNKIVGFVLEYPNGKRRGIFAPYLFVK